MCQLWKGTGNDRRGWFGGLYSEFESPSLMGGTDFQGSMLAYLFLKNTFGDFNDLEFDEHGYTLKVMVAEACQEREEWLDLFYANGSFVLSASICYAAFDFADIDVRILSQSNRTESRLEPVRVMNQDTLAYTFQDLRHAMGQDRSLPLDRRGVLELQEGTWEAAPNLGSSNAKSHSASNFRMATALAFTKSTLAPMLNTTESFMTGILTQSGYCSRSDDVCVVPEDMHVSTFL